MSRSTSSASAVHGENEVENGQPSLNSHDAQAGVQNIEAISQTWGQSSLIFAYVGIFLLAFFTSLEVQTTVNLTAYATSAFSKHSLLATVLVVQSVVNSVATPIMAKVANVFGRLEAFTFSILLYVLGYIQMAGSNNVRAFASAQIFYSAGSTGLRILQQVFIADTSDLLNRALFSSLPDVPFLVTVWAGPPLATNLLSNSTWRWGYGVWAIVLPVAFLPLALSLLLNMKKAAKQHLLPESSRKDRDFVGGAKILWYELDIMGLMLLSAAISLILIPMTLAASAKHGWHNASIIAMVVIGCVCFVVFPLWETNSKLAPQPFLSPRLFTNRTVLAGCTIGFFYFAVFYTSVYPYFFSYLRVVQGDSTTAAGHITQTFSFTSTVSSIVISLVIKYSGHYKYYITAGAAIYLLGIGLMIRYRVEGSSTSQIVDTQIALGIGGGMVNVPAQLGIQASVSHGDVAAATAIFLAIVEIGGAVGQAISGAVWTANLPKKLAQYLPPAAQADAAKIFGDLTVAAGYPMGSPERIAINRSYQETMNILLIIAACLCAPLMPLSLLMRNYRLESMDQKVRGNVIGQSNRTDGVRGGAGGGGIENEERDEDGARSILGA